MRIGELATLTGVSVRMLRYYEQQGLVVSGRTAGGQRVYGPDEPERVALVRTLFTAGLSSRTIAEVLPCADRPGERTSRQAHAAMSRERGRISASIDQLARARDALDELLAANIAHRSALAEAAARTA